MRPSPPIVAANSRLVLRGEQSSRVPSERSSSKCATWQPNVPATMMVLAVDVVGDGAADGDELRARRHRQEPAARNATREDVGQQHAGLALEHAARRVERDEAIEAARVSSRPPSFRQLSP